MSEDIIQAAARVLVRTTLALLQKDPHQWSTRPCATCSAISAIVGESFGCERYAREKGIPR